MSNRLPRGTNGRYIRQGHWLLIAVLWLVAANHGAAQDPKVLPGLGSLDATLEAVEPTEFVLDAPAGRAQAVVERHGLTIIRSLDAQSRKLYLVRGPSHLTDEELTAALRNDADVTHFELNAIATTPEVPSGLHLDQSPVYILDALGDRTLTNYYGAQAWSRYARQPGTSAIRLTDAHSAFGTGTGIVAIIDTGVDPTHPLLQSSLVAGYDFVSDTAGSASEWADVDSATAAVLDQSPVYILDQTTTAVPLNQSTIVAVTQATADSLGNVTLPPAFGHGTMIAGLIHLVAPTAKIMPLKAFTPDGSSRVFDIVRAIHYAVDHGAKVINMSFSTAELSPEITHAIDQATERGVICVSSAGNSGKQVLVYPAALRNVVGIGSTTSATPPVRSTFTNYGDSLVRIGAPGEGLITTYPGGHYAAAWGTSFSTALASGTAALLLQVNPGIDPSTASDYLGKADKMLLSGMGRGRLNVYEAVRHLPDEIAPAISLITPTGGVVRSTIAISASASDNVRVTSVRFLLDDQPLGSEDSVAPFEMMWNTTTVPNGTYSLTAVARDGAGNAASSTLTVTVANDRTAPAVAIIGPAAGASVSGTTSLSANAADDVAVLFVQFYVDGVPLGGPVTNAPYELAWNTAVFADGEHTVTAVALDTAGNAATSAAVTVTIQNGVLLPNM